MKTALKALGALLLIGVAVVLFIIVTPFAAIWRIHRGIQRDKLEIGIAHYLIEIAASFDQTANAAFGGFLSWLFLQKNRSIGYDFGDKDETISEVLGWNEWIGSLSKTGKTMVWFLDKIDSNHCKKAFNNGVSKANQKVNRYAQLHTELNNN